jgi:hypothetical protein
MRGANELTVTSAVKRLASVNLAESALRRPMTVIVAVVAVALAGTTCRPTNW